MVLADPSVAGNPKQGQCHLERHPPAGAVIFGGIIAAFHVMLLAAVFLFAGIMFLAGGD